MIQHYTLDKSAYVGICPKCHGTRRMPATGSYRRTIAGYDAITDTFACNNCGGQTMSLNATGKVPLRPDGSPCMHEFSGLKIGNCLYEYTCQHCSFHYIIDSGD